MGGSENATPEALRTVAQQAADLRLLILFGSRARGDGWDGSDWGLAYRVGPTFDPNALLAALLRTLEIDRIDLVDLDRAGSCGAGSRATAASSTRPTMRCACLPVPPAARPARWPVSSRITAFRCPNWAPARRRQELGPALTPGPCDWLGPAERPFAGYPRPRVQEVGRVTAGCPGRASAWSD